LYRNFLVVLAFIGVNNQRVGAQSTGENFEYLRSETQLLVPMAKDILNHDSAAYKFELNKQFGAALKELLSMRGSFEFPFDSLLTLSKVYSPDLSFRIFSWYIVDKDKDHFYYALIQRKVITSSGRDSLVVIPLHHTQSVRGESENMHLDQNNWLGALYYKVLMYKSRGYRRDFYTGKVEKAKNTYYVLLGWNGGSRFSNYKMVEVMTFDPLQVEKVGLGAPLFYFNYIPKYRVIFEYSDNAFFRLNTDMVDRKWPRKSVEMLIFDHLSPPNLAKKLELLDVGPDGSYDGLYFRKRRGGNFGYFKNVRVIEKRLDKFKVKEIATEKGAQEKGLFHPLMK